jgi:hypothetical protein
MKASRYALTGALAAVVAIAFGGCGGSSVTSPPPPPPPTPVPCTQTVVSADQGGVSARTYAILSFATAAVGRLDITADWTIASSPIGIFVVPANTCSTVEQLNARSCNFLVRSEPSTVKPRKVSVPNFATGSYNLVIANFADVDESVAYQVVLSQGSCAALTAAPPVSAAAGEASAVGVVRGLVGR